MKTIAFLALLSFTLLNSTAARFTYKLSDKQKLINTYSYKLNKTESVYLIIARNSATKKFEALPFLDNGSGNPVQLTTAEYNDNPSFIAKHLINNTLTLISYDDKTLIINDIDTNGNPTATESIANYGQPTSVFDDGSRTLIYTTDPANKKEMVVDAVTNVQDVKSVKVVVDAKYRDAFKRVTNHYPIAVNTAEYVKNGSVNDTRSYLNNGKIVLTYDDPEGTTQTMAVDPDTGTTQFGSYTNAVDKQKNLSSYVMDNTIVLVANNKDDFSIKAFDSASGNEVAAYSLKKDLAGFMKKDADMQKFLKTAAKNDMKATFTLNKAGNGYLATVDVVNIYTYQYQFNWAMYWSMYWTQQNMMMMQQQNQRLMNNVRGPFPCFDNGLYYEEQKDYSFTIPFTNDFKLMDASQSLTTDYKYIDGNKFMKPYMENKKNDFVSGDFMDAGMRIIYLDKSTKEIVMETITGLY